MLPVLQVCVKNDDFGEYEDVSQKERVFDGLEKSWEAPGGGWKQNCCQKVQHDIQSYHSLWKACAEQETKGVGARRGTETVLVEPWQWDGNLRRRWGKGEGGKGFPTRARDILQGAQVHEKYKFSNLLAIVVFDGSAAHTPDL